MAWQDGVPDRSYLNSLGGHLSHWFVLATCALFDSQPSACALQALRSSKDGGVGHGASISTYLGTTVITTKDDNIESRHYEEEGSKGEETGVVL